MRAFEAILILLLGAVGLLALARRYGVPYPALLALAGAAVALSPVAIPLTLDPQLVLALFVAPILLDAAYDAPVRDLKRAWLPLVGMALIAVALTTLGVAVLAHALVPQLPWAAAVALGAIVAPPDASAATAVLRGVPLPHRLRVLLEGESLLNDATALLIYRLAVAAALSGGSVRAEAVAPAFLLSVVGSVVVGPLLAVVLSRITARVQDVASSIILQFIGTFGVWIIAEALQLSAVLTVVTYAMVVARWAPARTPARLRVPSYAVWETGVTALNALAFTLIGIQLGQAIAAAQPGQLAQWSWFAGAMLAAVIAIRMAWAMCFVILARLLPPGTVIDPPPGAPGPTVGGALLIGWAGMRGVVTVATALALPTNFPQRDLILFTAFAVVLGTLVLHGFTLKPMVAWLRIPDDHPVEREVREARVALAEAGLTALRGDDSADAGKLRGDLELERRTAADAERGDGRPVLPAKRLRARVNDLRRTRLIELRRDGAIGDEAFHALEEELDYAELAIAQRT